jgi:hypothetical protein
LAVRGEQRRQEGIGEQADRGEVVGAEGLPVRQGGGQGVPGGVRLAPAGLLAGAVDRLAEGAGSGVAERAFLHLPQEVTPGLAHRLGRGAQGELPRGVVVTIVDVVRAE